MGKITIWRPLYIIFAVLILAGLGYGLVGSGLVAKSMFAAFDPGTSGLYAPTFGFVYCTVTDTGVPPQQWDIVKDGKYQKGTDTNDIRDTIDVFCSDEGHQVYTNQCEFSYKSGGPGNEYKVDYFLIQKCHYDTNGNKICTKELEQSFVLGGVQEEWSSVIYLNHNEWIHVEASELGWGQLETGDLIMRLDADRWGLMTLDGGYLAVEDGCDLAQLSENREPVKCECPAGTTKCGCENGAYPTRLDFGKYINYMVGYNEIQGAQIDTFGGKDVWCVGKNYLMPVLETKGGVKYVGERQYYAEVQCCPRTPGCGADFKFTSLNPTNIECNNSNQCWWGWTPSAAGAEVCTSKCESGKCVSDQCHAKECSSSSDCPATASVCNAEYKCVAGNNVNGGKGGDDKEGIDWLPFAIVGGAIALGLLMKNKTEPSEGA